MIQQNYIVEELNQVDMPKKENLNKILIEQVKKSNKLMPIDGAYIFKLIQLTQGNTKERKKISLQIIKEIKKKLTFEEKSNLLNNLKTSECDFLREENNIFRKSSHETKTWQSIKFLLNTDLVDLSLNKIRISLKDVIKIIQVMSFWLTSSQKKQLLENIKKIPLLEDKFSEIGLIISKENTRINLILESILDLQKTPLFTDIIVVKSTDTVSLDKNSENLVIKDINNQEKVANDKVLILQDKDSGDQKKTCWDGLNLKILFKQKNKLECRDNIQWRTRNILSLLGSGSSKKDHIFALESISGVYGQRAEDIIENNKFLLNIQEKQTLQEALKKEKFDFLRPSESQNAWLKIQVALKIDETTPDLISMIIDRIAGLIQTKDNDLEIEILKILNVMKDCLTDNEKQELLKELQQDKFEILKEQSIIGLIKNELIDKNENNETINENCVANVNLPNKIVIEENIKDEKQIEKDRLFIENFEKFLQKNMNNQFYELGSCAEKEIRNSCLRELPSEKENFTVLFACILYYFSVDKLLSQMWKEEQYEDKFSADERAIILEKMSHHYISESLYMVDEKKIREKLRNLIDCLPKELDPYMGSEMGLALIEVSKYFLFKELEHLQPVQPVKKVEYTDSALIAKKVIIFYFTMLRIDDNNQHVQPKEWFNIILSDVNKFFLAGEKYWLSIDKIFFLAKYDLIDLNIKSITNEKLILAASNEKNHAVSTDEGNFIAAADFVQQLIEFTQGNRKERCEATWQIIQAANKYLSNSEKIKLKEFLAQQSFCKLELNSSGQKSSHFTFSEGGSEYDFQDQKPELQTIKNILNALEPKYELPSHLKNPEEIIKNIQECINEKYNCHTILDKILNNKFSLPVANAANWQQSFYTGPLLCCYESCESFLLSEVDYNNTAFQTGNRLFMLLNLLKVVAAGSENFGEEFKEKLNELYRTVKDESLIFIKNQNEKADNLKKTLAESAQEDEKWSLANSGNFNKKLSNNSKDNQSYYDDWCSLIIQATSIEKIKGPSFWNKDKEIDAPYPSDAQEILIRQLQKVKAIPGSFNNQSCVPKEEEKIKRKIIFKEFFGKSSVVVKKILDNEIINLKNGKISLFFGKFLKNGYKISVLVDKDNARFLDLHLSKEETIKVTEALSNPNIKDEARCLALINYCKTKETGLFVIWLRELLGPIFNGELNYQSNFDPKNYKIPSNMQNEGCKNLYSFEELLKEGSSDLINIEKKHENNLNTIN